MIVVHLRILTVGVDTGDASTVGAYCVANEVLDRPQETGSYQSGNTAVVLCCAIHVVCHSHTRSVEVPSTGMSTDLLSVNDRLVVVLGIAQEHKSGDGVAETCHDLTTLIGIHDELVELPAVAHVDHSTRTTCQCDTVIVLHIAVSPLLGVCPLVAINQFLAAVAYPLGVGLNVLYTIYEIRVNADLERQRLLTVLGSKCYLETCFLTCIPRSLKLLTP